MKLSEKTTAQLHSELKLTKAVTVALVIVLTLLFLVNLYGLLTKEDNSTFITLMIIPFALSPIVFINLSTMKKIKKELASR